MNRRSFLKTLGVSLVGVAVAPIAARVDLIVVQESECQRALRRMKESFERSLWMDVAQREREYKI